VPRLEFGGTIMLKGFRDFIMRGNVVDLAVAVVIGAAFKSVVDAFVANIITPLIAAIAGKPNFSTLAWHWHKSVFQYGAFLNTVVSFLLVAAAIYFAVVAPLNALAERRAKKLAAGVPDDEPKPEEIQLLEQIRDLLKTQQG
jgi:large conductance mechanosensitive channel